MLEEACLPAAALPAAAPAGFAAGPAGVAGGDAGFAAGIRFGGGPPTRPSRRPCSVWGSGGAVGSAFPGAKRLGRLRLRMRASTGGSSAGGSPVGGDLGGGDLCRAGGGGFVGAGWGGGPKVRRRGGAPEAQRWRTSLGGRGSRGGAPRGGRVGGSIRVGPIQSFLDGNLVRPYAIRVARASLPIESFIRNHQKHRAGNSPPTTPAHPLAPPACRFPQKTNVTRPSLGDAHDGGGVLVFTMVMVVITIT